jgi:hypothetical protein
LALLAAWSAACGGGSRSPATPTVVATPDTGLSAGTILTVVSGEAGAPVAGAAVTVAGRTYTTDASGRARLEQRADLGALVDLVAPGMLDRQTLLRAGVTQFSLWPRTTAAGIDENYTAVIVYTSASSSNPSPTGALALVRLAEGTSSVVLVPSAEILADGAAHDAQAQAAGNITAASGGTVRYSLARERPSSGVIFDLAIDPSDTECVERRVRGYTQLMTRRGEIVGGHIVYCSAAIARSSTASHEVGHTFGLRHSPADREVMFASFSSARSSDFGAREAMAMHLMSQRRGGNRFPDNDRDATSSSVGQDGTITIACR